MKKSLIVFALLFFLTLPGLSNARDEKQVTTLEEVVVTATKVEQNTMDVPFFASVVTREEFEKMGATTIEEALRSVPGLQIGTQGNAFPHIEVRGFRDTKDLAVLIDGVPFRQLNGSADLTMIPLSIVERIEFVKGPSSSIWGRGAVAGILNIILPGPTMSLSCRPKYKREEEALVLTRVLRDWWCHIRTVTLC